MYESNFETVFIDVNQEMIDKINTDKSYPIKIVCNEYQKEILIKNVRAVHSKDAVDEISTADIIFTSAGVNVLPYIAPVLKEGLAKRTCCELAKNKKRVLLITNDMARPMPSNITIPALIDEIQKFNKDVIITILIASGLHRKMTNQELIDKMEKNIVDNYRVLVHNAYDKNELVFLTKGQTININLGHDKDGIYFIELRRI